jgi:integrase
MARSVRDAKLENRTNRLKLPAGKRHWRTIGKGLALGYRRGATLGTWYARVAVAGQNQYRLQSLGEADDFRDADGTAVLDFFQAQDRARQVADAGLVTRSRYTVSDAMRDYLEWFATAKKSVATTTAAVNAHILPALGQRAVVNLTAEEVHAWHVGLAKAAPRLRGGKVRTIDAKDADAMRGRRASANRVLAILRAALNRPSVRKLARIDWQEVRPFRDATANRIRYLNAAESRKLINATAPEFRPLVRAALLTGCRYGELVALKGSDFDGRRVHVRESKSGKPRVVPLTAEGVEFFKAQAAGLATDALLFTRPDGQPWGKSHQARPMQAACKAAGIPPVSFHELRHSYASALAQKGTSLQVIAAALGHADTRITERHYSHIGPSYVEAAIRKALPRYLPKSRTKSNVVTLDGKRRTAR